MMGARSADICNLVVAEGTLLVGAVADRLGLVDRVCAALINKLAADGTLRVRGEHVSAGGDGTRARMLAEQSSLSFGPPRSAEIPPPVVRPKPEAVAERAQKPRLPLPVAVEVKRGVPLPPKHRGHRRAPCPWPFGTMQVGDSIHPDVPPGFKVCIRVADDELTVGCWCGTEEQIAKLERHEASPPAEVPAVPSSRGIRVRGNGKATASAS